MKALIQVIEHRFLVRLRTMYQIMSVLFLSAFVNLVTGESLPQCFSRGICYCFVDWGSLLCLLAAGCYFQSLYFFSERWEHLLKNEKLDNTLGVGVDERLPFRTTVMCAFLLAVVGIGLRVYSTANTRGRSEVVGRHVEPHESSATTSAGFIQNVPDNSPRTTTWTLSISATTVASIPEMPDNSKRKADRKLSISAWATSPPSNARATSEITKPEPKRDKAAAKELGGNSGDEVK